MGINDRKSPFLLKGILPINRASALRDALAGISLASMDIPQVLGYARIAGMPTVTGLYTALVPIAAFTIVGASRHLVVAADSATATIFASRVSTMAPMATEYVTLASMVALLTAAMLLRARIFKLGFLADFLSRTVLAGFLASVGVQVCIAMLGMTVPIPSSRSLAQLLYVIAHFTQTHGPTLALTALVVTVILLAKRFKPRWPVALVAVIGSIVASNAFDFSAHGIVLLGPVAGGLPPLSVPAVTWQQALDLVPVAASCFVMVIAQSAAAARVFAQQYHEPVDTNADILGLVAANAAAGLSGTFVVQPDANRNGRSRRHAQPVRTACVRGGRGHRAAVFQRLQYLPHCVLAGIVFTIALGLINVNKLAAIRAESPGEFTLALVTAAAVVLIGVEHGILLAVALSLMRHVRHSYRPHTMMLAPTAPGGRWQFMPVKSGTITAPGLIVYRFGADLFYANDHLFCDEARKLADRAPGGLRWFVVDAGAITDLDYSAARSIGDLIGNLRERGIAVVFGRVNAYLRADMDRHGITSMLGAHNVFTTLHEALAAAGIEPMAREPSTV